MTVRLPTIPVFHHFLRSFAVVLLALVLASGCTVRMAPDYDATNVSKIDQLSESLSKLVAGFDEQQSYADRKSSYDDNFAKLNALIIRMQARPSPQPVFLDWLGSKIANKNVSKILRESDAPSIASLQNILKNLRWMSEHDQKKQLSRMMAVLTWNEIQSFLTDAMVYEQALNR